jgi:signal transduction histidine kinase
VDVGWQDICLKFHRAHPETIKNCHGSDTDLTVGVSPGEFKIYRCRNNMWHIVTPIFVGGRHMGNLFLGQFFFENEELDYDLFRSQARRYGFPEEEYMAALEAVPRHSEECVNMGKAVFLRLTDMFSKLSYGNIKLARSLTERDQLTATLQDSEARLRQKKQLLEELNSKLEEKVRVEVSKNREKDVMLIQQNRQAALGEILDYIAHQWKQPLYIISLITYLLKENDSLKKEEVNETADKIIGQVDHMSQTLNDFRDFYRPDKEKSVFLIKESIDRALTFIMPALQFESIEVETRVDPGLSVLGYPKEFAQVILNLVSNARDAFKEKKVEKPNLVIRAFTEDNMAVVTVTDNAGGICEATIANIFDLNFTTKELSGGTGIGLYMSKNIIERHMGGVLTAGNVADGAQFSIKLGIAGS